ncbi:SDR family NAD(P)-dependent oxidoreductase [Bacillus sp. OK048]|uniref:SDR family oxidoreductase n=1 Tax=Bacillus sp. OK048 TaxID=1882761 RepID=UPI000891A4D9|nr:SDR family NAD(P)-dependent oxidoreductase [Bacillus sp. OK048]SDL95801.1 3-oxoacyl-[acyl-carrier protein] reductase [Bacillus sp. OK048]
MNVKDRVILVTGSGSGIGEGIATRLAANGAKVIINDIDLAKAENVAHRLRENGYEAIGLQADITNTEQVNQMVDTIINHYQRIDGLVNNTGVVRDNLILKMPEEDFDFVLNVNLKGAWICSKAVLGQMKQQEFGRIVNISSRAWLGQVGQSNYSASKGGLVSLTRALALEFAKFNITVNCIAPGLIDTPLIRSLKPEVQQNLIKAQPTPIIGQPTDVANTVLFFTSEEARYITGQVLHVDGGKSLGARNI